MDRFAKLVKDPVEHYAYKLFPENAFFKTNMYDDADGEWQHFNNIVKETKKRARHEAKGAELVEEDWRRPKVPKAAAIVPLTSADPPATGGSSSDETASTVRSPIVW